MGLGQPGAPSDRGALPPRRPAGRNTAVSVPGNLGVFHYLTVLALAVYGVDREIALAYAIVLYAVAILPKLVLGSVIMAIGPRGFSFRAAFSSGPREP